MTHGGNYKPVHGRGQWTSRSHGENGRLCHFLVSKYGAIERSCFSFYFCLCFQIGLPIMVNPVDSGFSPLPPMSSNHFLKFLQSSSSWIPSSFYVLQTARVWMTFANIGEEWLFLSWLLKSHRITHTWKGGHLGYGMVLAAEPVTSKYLPVLFIEESDINNL